MQSISSETTEGFQFSDRIKSETAAAHRDLETTTLSTDIVSPLLTSGRYADYLTAMYSVVADVEKRVFPVLHEIIDDIGSRRKLSGITSDLKSLDKEPPREQEIFGEIDSEAFAMGIFYVVEGSVLGGRYILQNVRKALPDAGTEYFEGYGTSTGKKWKSYISTLNQYASAGHGEEIIRGANHAFIMIKSHLNKFD